jgi:hypothetical protein
MAGGAGGEAGHRGADGWVKEIDRRLRNLDRAFRRLAQYVGGEALAEPHGRES